ncbi:HYR domain-containing protein, partial [uncultured Algibacter sp.]|uniref:HYR domain-containing protein n=1 Tax=uncultured Algibacter sp. TaxID=298659 RepID=UPI0030ED7ED0
MKNFTLFSNKNKVLTIIVLLLGLASFAQVQKEFKSRWDGTVNGNLSTIGNNMLSRTATGAYNGTNGNHDYSDNVYVDIDGFFDGDGDSADDTFNSSSANFSNPEPLNNCLSIKKAYLYWAAADKEPTSDLNSENQPNWKYNEVLLMLPGETTYKKYGGKKIYRGRDSHFSNDPYVCVKEITGDVKNLTSFYGKYQVANVEAKTGSLNSHPSGRTGTSGGWQIVFIYESPALNAKNISIFDGYAHVTRDVNNFDVLVDGFQTIPSGPVKTKMLIGALEGDRDLSGDQLQVKNAAGNFVSISTPSRPVNNFFNSKITQNGADFVDRNPMSLNTLGFDAGSFDLNNPNNEIISNNQTSAIFRMTSNQETYGLYLLGMAVDVFEPSINPLKLNLDTTNLTENPGGIIPFQFKIQNTGNDNVENLVISTTLGAQLNLNTPVSLPNGVSYTYNTSTKFLEFKVANGTLNVGSPELIVNFNLVVANECYFLTTNCDLALELQFSGAYNGILNPKTQNTLSSESLDGCGIGNELPTVINITQPVANWRTVPKALDRTIRCNDAVELAIAQSLVPEIDKCLFTITKTSGSFVATTCGSGTYTNTWSFTDACGVTSSPYIQTITVEDTTAPTGTAPSDITGLQCISNIPVADIAAVTDEADNCGGAVAVTVADTNNGGLGTTLSPYIVTRTYTLTDCSGLTTNLVQNIIVIDNTDPTISCPADVAVDVDAGACFATITLTDPTTSDDCGILSVTNDAPATYPVGTTTVTWTVTDNNNNTSTCTQDVVVTDNVNPLITCAADVTVNVDAGACFATITLTDPTTSDDCGILSVTNDAPATYLVGTTTVTWTVTDNNNNTATCTQDVVVTDNVNPLITCAADVTVNVDAGACFATITLTDPTTSDDCG